MKERLAFTVKHYGRQALGVFLIFALMCGVFFSMNLMAQAKTESSSAVDNLFVYARSSEGDILLKVIPYAEVAALEHGYEAGGTNYYCSYTDNLPTTGYCEAKGITLPELLDYVKQETSVAGAAGLTYTGSDRMRFMASDSYGSYNRYYTYDELYGIQRYYFPALYDYWDSFDFETVSGGYVDANYHDDCGGATCGGSSCKYFTAAKNAVFATAVPMETVLATNSYAGRTISDLAGFISANGGIATGCLADELDALNSLRLTIPQSEKVMRTGERTASLNFKWVYNILVDMDGGAPITSQGATAAPTATAIIDEEADTLTITLTSATEGANIYHSIEGDTLSALTAAPRAPQYLYEEPLVFELKGANPPASVNFYAVAVKEGYSNTSFSNRVTSIPVVASDPEPALTYVLQADKDALQVGDTVQLTATLSSDQDNYNLYGAQYDLTFDSDAFSNLAVTPDVNWEYGEHSADGKTTLTFTLLDREGIVADAVSDIATISATAAQAGTYVISCTAAVATNAAAVELTSVSPAAPLTFTVEDDPITGEPKSGIKAVEQIFVDESTRSLSYTIMLGDVQDGGIFKIGANFDAQRLDYVDYTLNLPAATFAALGGFSDGEFYDQASGEFRSRVYLTALGAENLLQVSAPTALLTINFRIKDSVIMEEIEQETIVLEGILDFVEVTRYDGGMAASIIYDTVVEGEDVARTELLKFSVQYDLNGDGQFNEADILLVIVKYFMVTDEDDEWEDAKVFDIHENGEINTADIIALFNMLEW